jgi:hypothetical protein
VDFGRAETKAVTFVVGGIAAVVIAGWAVFVYVNKDSKTADAKVQTAPITINNNNTNTNTVNPTISPKVNQNAAEKGQEPKAPVQTVYGTHQVLSKNKISAA